MPKPFLLAALLGLPLLASAQTTSPSPRFYVGAGAMVLSSRPFQSYGNTYVGPALTAGWQFAPRLALQISGAYHWDNRSYGLSYFDSNFGATIDHTDATERLFTFPLLLRATFTAPTSPWHVDVLGGAILRHATSSYLRTVTAPTGTVYFTTREQYADTNVSLALGPGLRYSLSSQLDVALNALVDLNLESGYYNFSNRLSSNLALGANFYFGR